MGQQEQSLQQSGRVLLSESEAPLERGEELSGHTVADSKMTDSPF